MSAESHQHPPQQHTKRKRLSMLKPQSSPSTHSNNSDDSNYNNDEEEKQSLRHDKIKFQENISITIPSSTPRRKTLGSSTGSSNSNTPAVQNINMNRLSNNNNT